MNVNYPDGPPPPLTPRAARALLAVLVDAAKEEYGEAWREHLRDEEEPDE